MPSHSVAGRRGSIVRQFSLQGPTNSQTPAGRRGLKKQQSEDELRSKTLESVEVTGQGWSVGGDKSEAGLRTSLQDVSKVGQAKTATGSRPKPVKLAWADRRQDSAENPTGVEVVARKCQGQPRPLTAKAQRITHLPLLGDKDTLVYTRQQLAERLRIAWREREKNKPNLNIFLAHAAETAPNGNDDPGTARSTATFQPEILIQDSVSFRSVSASESSISSETGRISRVEPTRMLPRDGEQREQTVRFATEKTEQVKSDFELKSILKNGSGAMKRSDFAEKDGEQQRNSASELHRSVTDCPDFKIFPVSDTSKKFGSNLTNLNYPVKSVNIQEKEDNLKMVDSLPDGKENLRTGSTWDSDLAESTKLEEIGPCEIRGVNDMMPLTTAKERRASFRRGSLLNKAVDKGFPPSTANSSEEIDDDDVSEDNSSRIKVFLKKTENHRVPLTRTFSAPSRNELPSPKEVSHHADSKVSQPPKLQYTSSVDLGGIDEDLSGTRGRVKSAPIRRKQKTTASRRKLKEKEQESSDDEKYSRDLPKKKSTRRKAASKMSASEIVTMVSLVSPATSDAEDSVIPLPEESWTEEQKEEKPSGQADEFEQRPASNVSKEFSSFVIQKFVSLRKSNKTVSFVQHPPMNRSYSASFPSRRAPAGTPIIVPTPVITNPALTPAQIQEREKRPQPPSSGIPPGTDNRGVKRRLIRTVSAPQAKDDEDGPERGVSSKVNTSYNELRKKEVDKIDEGNEEETVEKKNEPEFKTPKEKECWILYRKMLAKGVAVSFDTVLRGMLTPTEYRLRRNQLLSSC